MTRTPDHVTTSAGETPLGDPLEVALQAGPTTPLAATDRVRTAPSAAPPPQAFPPQAFPPQAFPPPSTGASVTGKEGPGRANVGSTTPPSPFDVPPPVAEAPPSPSSRRTESRTRRIRTHASHVRLGGDGVDVSEPASDVFKDEPSTPPDDSHTIHEGRDAGPFFDPYSDSILQPPRLDASDDGASGSVDTPAGTVVRFVGESKMPRPVELKAAGIPASFEPQRGRAAQGRYQIGQVIGRGGMGVVRLVKDLDLGRTVAMKTLNPGDPDAKMLVASLIAEGQTTGQLEHPNIVPVYELGVLPDGTVFYTMRRVSGSTLKEVLHRLRNGDRPTRLQFTERKLLSLLQQVCLALHYAHSCGVVHRDVKPDNIAVGAYGEVQLLDWGIAYMIGRVSDPLARPGLVVGTPHYMAPEQARGEIHRVDGRTDVFSLGVVLHEILTLCTPVVERGTERVLEAVRKLTVAARPEKRADGSAVPDALADICVRALAPNPENRMASAGELAERIEQYLEGSAERERRAALAMEEFAIGLQAYSTYMALRRQRETLTSDLERRRREVRRWDPVSLKRTLAEDEARAQLMSFESSRAFTTTANHLHAVLGLEPEHAHARSALANLYWTRFEDAERRGELEDIVYFADLFLRFNDSVRGPLPSGGGHITVRTFPEGGEVAVYDFGVGVPDLRSKPGRSLGTAPVEGIELPMGMYLLVARKEGYRHAQQAVFVRPGLHQKYLLNMPAWTAEEPLVGRDGELGLLEYNLERTIHGRELRRLLISGSDGMGKARLVAAFSEYIDSLDTIVQFFYAECHEAHELVPYSPVTAAIRNRAGLKPEDPPAAVRRQLRTLLRAAVESAGPASASDASRIEVLVETLLLVPGMAPPSPDMLPPTLHGDTAYELRDKLDLAFVEFMRLLTRVNPALFYFQGIEHLDDASLRVLQLAPRELAGVPLFIMGVRADGVTNTGWDELIALEPLTETPSAAMIRNLLKGPLPHGLHERILAVTGGVPWLIVDAVKRMVASGSLVEISGRHVAQEGLPPAVPLTMDQARRRQLEELPPALYAGLTVAAVTGDTFWLETLEALDIEDAARVCRELEEREFIRALPFSRYPGTRAFAFRSVFFREIVYDAIADSERRPELHRRVAQWMTGRSRGDIREVAELGRHEERGGNDQAALGHYLRLGDIARACAATGIARECYRQALANARTKSDQEALEQRLESVRMTASRP